MPRSSAHASLTDDDLLDRCRKLYSEHGFEALTFKALKAEGLYFPLYQRGLTKTEVLKRLGLEAEYESFESNRPRLYAGTVRERWTWERIVRIATETKAAHGHLPPAAWFQRNKLGSLVYYVYQSGHTWDEVQEAVGALPGGNFVESRNGLRWLSHAEASLSNFLYARGIDHRKGERYPDAFADVGDAKYAIYDMHFLAADQRWIDVEVWGDNPDGHGRETYARRRGHKETFNRDNAAFLGIDHTACYQESALTEILEPFIGRIVPFRFDKPTDSVLQSTHWSNADELLAYCRKVASDMPDGIFPSESWLRKRGRFAERPGVALNTLAVYVKLWLGGVRTLRRLLGQEHASTIEWDEERALREYKRFHEQHAHTPGQVLGAARKEGSGGWPDDVVADAGRVDAAVTKYAGGALAAQSRIGLIPSKRSWDDDSVSVAYEQFKRENGITPRQAVGRWSSQSKLALSEELSKQAMSILNAYKKRIGTPPRTEGRLEWTAQRALAEYKRFFEKHGKTPAQVVGAAHRAKSKGLYSDELVSEANRIASACNSHLGGAKRARELLGMAPTRVQWTAESAKAAYDDFVATHGLTPSQVVVRSRQKNAGAASGPDLKEATRVLNAYRRYVLQSSTD